MKRINLTEQMENMMLGLIKRGCKIKVIAQNYMDVENSYIMKVSLKTGGKEELIWIVNNEMVAHIPA